MTMDGTSDARADMMSDGRAVDADHAQRNVPRADGLSLPIFDSLFSAALSPNRTACKSVIARSLGMGISQTDLADKYIPAVAHRMGEMWCADTLGFAEVTIGVARLQAMLRDLGPEWIADNTARANAPLVLIVTHRGAQHTLGAVILGGQLRRRGCSVRMALDSTREALAQMVPRIRFDAIFISASQSESLEKTRKMVDFFRSLDAKLPPIVLGGGLVDQQGDIASLVGVDIVTSNIDEAIEKCSLTITQNEPAPSAVRR